MIQLKNKKPHLIEEWDLVDSIRVSHSTIKQTSIFLKFIENGGNQIYGLVSNIVRL
jgi:hypothetical protein